MYSWNNSHFLLLINTRLICISSKLHISSSPWSCFFNTFWQQTAPFIFHSHQESKQTTYYLKSQTTLHFNTNSILNCILSWDEQNTDNTVLSCSQRGNNNGHASCQIQLKTNFTALRKHITVLVNKSQVHNCLLEILSSGQGQDMYIINYWFGDNP